MAALDTVFAKYKVGGHAPARIDPLVATRHHDQSSGKDVRLAVVP
jgi:hypothetical protein